MRGEELEKLLRELGFSKIRIIHNANGDTNANVCCPWHHERNPSCGISALKEKGKCFVCKTEGFTLTTFVAHVLGVTTKRARDWLDERKYVSKRQIIRRSEIRRYDSSNVQIDGADSDATTNNIIILPNYKLAPYKSGKIVHPYMLDRGFSKETCRIFSFGWDEDKSRVTIPVKGRNGELYGFIGRAVLEKGDSEYRALYGDSDKYLMYEFQRSKVLYPMDHFKVENETAILVEGSLDAVWMHQCGFKNTLSLLTASLSKYQLNLLPSLGVKKVILFLDNDSTGQIGAAKAYKLLKHDFVVYTVDYPDDRKDPASYPPEILQEIIQNAYYYGRQSLKRID
jgi:DNA primase